MTVLLCAPETSTAAERATRRNALCELTADSQWRWRWHAGIRTWRLEHGRR